MPFPLPLNQLFLLNAIGYVVLVAAFWLAPRVVGTWSWLVNAVLIVYSAASIGGWIMVGMPNPSGLGYLSKAIEVVLIGLLVVHASRTLRAHGAGAALSSGLPAA